jgi:hypothetical protein
MWDTISPYPKRHTIIRCSCNCSNCTKLHLCELSQQTATLTPSEKGAPWLLDHVLHLVVVRVVPSHVWSERRLLVAERATNIEVLLSLPIAGKRT